ncbi:CATL1 protein, partial [Polypterus senegalus]
MKMNQFGDLTNLEYQQILGALVNITVRKKRQIGGTVSATELRSKAMLLNVTSIDYRTLGYVTEVKNQGACGSCWAFSTTGAIEGQLFKKTGMLVSLSEQNLVDCSKDYGTYGCKGAWMGNAYKYVLYNGGIESALTYPYIAKDNQPCHYNSSRSAASITDYKFLPKGNEQALADALATIGPITVAVDASLPSFQFYKSGIYNDPRCSSTKLNHAVLLIGYGSEAGQDFWVIKNSWGTQWGENGYMRMARTTTNYCGIASYTLFPVMVPSALLCPGVYDAGKTALRRAGLSNIRSWKLKPIGQKETPLANAVFWAARKGNLAVLQLLLNSGRVDVDCKDNTGTTTLMVASYSGHTDCVRELILQGADINLQRETGSTSLFFAAQQGNNDIVKLLFEYGASTEFQTKEGGTALSAACQYGHSTVVETLLKNGANVHDELHTLYVQSVELPTANSFKLPATINSNGSGGLKFAS